MEAGGEVRFFVPGREDDGEFEEVIFYGACGPAADGLGRGWVEVGDLLLGEEAEDGFAGAIDWDCHSFV